MEVLHRIPTEPVIPPARTNPAVPSALDTLIVRMLDKNAARRPTPGDVIEQLTALERHAPQPARSPAKASMPRTTVGRKAERAILLASFDAVSSGRGMIVAVSGEPGIGKTTLVEEFLDELEAGGRMCTAGRGRCSERLAGAEAYLPWFEALESLVRGADGPAAAPLLKAIAPTWYAQVVPLAADDSSAARLLADVKVASQERLKREVSQFLRELGRSRPLVLFFDDLHWADASTVDVLTYVADRFDEMRVLVIVTYRPTELALAGHPLEALKLELVGRGLCRELPVGYLGRADVDAYLALLYPNHQFGDALPALVQERTEGNALFMVDLVQFFRDQRLLAEEHGQWRVTRDVRELEWDLPASVSSLIQRKIERLGEDDRRLLVAASVQGEEFHAAVVAKALKADAADVEERLDRLARVHTLMRMVQEEELPDGTLTVRYRFVHVLYQNAFYASLTPTKRASLSASVGETLLSFYRDREMAVASQLALLFEAARDYERSASFFEMAARSAAGKAADREAIVLAERGLCVIGRLITSSERRRKELALNLTLGHALLRREGFLSAEAEHALRRAREISLETGVRSRELFAAMEGLVARVHSAGDLWKALSITEEMLDEAKHLSDASLEGIAIGARGTVLFHMGRLVEARTFLEHGLTILYEASPGESWERFVDWRVVVLSFLTCTLGVLGYPDRGSDRSAEALDLARRLSQPFAEVFALCWATYLGHLRRSWNETQAWASRMAELSEYHRFPSFGLIARGVLGRSMVELGDPRVAVMEIEQYLADYEVTGGMVLNSVMFRAWLAAAYARAGEISAGLRVLDEALADALLRQERWYEAEIHRLKGELLQKQNPGNETEAERSFLQAIDIARNQKAKWFELRAAVSLGRLWQSQGRREEARALVTGVYDWFTEGFDLIDLQEARALIEELG